MKVELGSPTVVVTGFVANNGCCTFAVAATGSGIVVSVAFAAMETGFVVMSFCVLVATGTCGCSVRVVGFWGGLVGCFSAGGLSSLKFLHGQSLDVGDIRIHPLLDKLLR